LLHRASHVGDRLFENDFYFISILARNKLNLKELTFLFPFPIQQLGHRPLEKAIFIALLGRRMSREPDAAV
jgi:hypothetical protein